MATLALTGVPPETVTRLPDRELVARLWERGLSRPEAEILVEHREDSVGLISCILTGTAPPV